MARTILFLLASLLLPLGQANGQLGSMSDSQVPRISAASAYYKYQTGKVIIVDAMKPSVFAKQHIVGAFSLPGEDRKKDDLDRIAKATLPFPKGAEVIVYCN